MIKAVLLDMDNTLLHNPDKAFAVAFLNRFDSHFEQELGITASGQYFKQALQSLADQQRPWHQTNQQRIVDVMSRATNIAADRIAEALAHFYATAYNELAPCVGVMAGAANLIQQLHTAGYTIVIATNPLYPVAAIEQRLKWAQLPSADEWCALITGADVMHFSKADPAYYAEILGRVGVEPDEAIMLGDRLTTDIEPAQLLGIKTYHVHAGQTLEHFGDNLDMYLQSPMQPLAPPMIAPQLRGNIGALYGFLASVQESYWLQRPTPDEWSIMQILCHLLDAERTIERPFLERIQAEGNPFIAAPPEPGPDIPVCAEDGYGVAATFAEERHTTLDFLAGLATGDWQRRARHSIFGLTTLLEMAYFTAQHDRLHLNQLCQTIGRCE